MVTQRKNILGTALRLAVLHQFPIENYLAQRILQNPDNFGFLRPTAIATEAAKPAVTAQPVDSKSTDKAVTEEQKGVDNKK